MQQPILKISNLETCFFTEHGCIKAVNGINLSIEQGEIVGLVGESGCGKSTLGFSILRLVPPPGRITKGEIWFNGEDLMLKNPEEIRKIRGRDISMIFQEPSTSLNPVFTVGNQIMEAILLHQNVSKKEAKKIMIGLLKVVGIPDPERVENFYPLDLSGGMQQRIMIAIAIACKPKLIIADEPTTALDVTTQAQILDLLKGIRKELGTSILYITHNLAVICQFCDKVGIAYAGDIVEFADKNVCFMQPKHPYTIKLFNAIPRIDKKLERLETIPGTVCDVTNSTEGCKFYSRCQFAMKICKEKIPPPIFVEPKHMVKCWIFNKS
jgi:oligopeptide/dipeptide ABC transporter ATP-binding protein